MGSIIQSPSLIMMAAADKLLSQSATKLPCTGLHQVVQVLPVIGWLIARLE